RPFSVAENRKHNQVEQHQPTKAQKAKNGKTQKDRPATGNAERLIAGWSSPVARQAHNLKVVGSNPTPATTDTDKSVAPAADFVILPALPTACRSVHSRIVRSSPCSVA